MRETRKRLRIEGGHDRRHQERQRNTDAAPRAGKHERFGEEQLNQATRTGAKRDAHDELAAPPLSAREEQAGDVDAGGREDHRHDGAERDEHGTSLTNDVGLKRD